MKTEKNKKINEKRAEALIQIAILIVYIFAFTYFFSLINEKETYLNEERKINFEEKFIKLYGKFLKLIFSEKNFVSASELSDLSGTGGNLDPNGLLQQYGSVIGGGMSMCTDNDNGVKCQIMSNADCQTQCKDNCVEIANSLSQDYEQNVPDECKLGACQDLKEGTCAKNSPKGSCDESKGFKWYDDPNGNVEECVQACCLLGTEAIFTTKLQCEKNAESLGLEFGSERAKFERSTTSEAECLELANSISQIACTFDIKDENGQTLPQKTCKLTTEEECNSLGGMADKNGYLCSASALNSECKPKNHTTCVESLDGVYWFDSCGNKENIYDASKTAPDEKFIAKKDSCVLGENGDWLKNQKTCGNCDRTLGSTCGEKTDKEKLNDEKQNVVCRDLGCEEILADGRKVRREHGETWCAYQSNFGVSGLGDILGQITYNTDFKYGGDTNGLGSILGGFGDGGLGDIVSQFSSGTDFLGGLLGKRSMGPPGSQFFRKSCNEGKITIENCAQARSGICVEERQKQKDSNKDISVASCRANRWQECLNYNPPDRGESKNAVLGKIKVELAMAACAKDPDCWVKRIEIGKDFKFPVCLPKYPPGFNIGTASQGEGTGENAGPSNIAGQLGNFANAGGQGGTGGEHVCAYASQTCPAIFLKECVDKPFCLVVKWKCKANCECVKGDEPDSAQPSKKFVEEMSDFCTSLGDCGVKVNYKGKEGGLGSFKLKKCVVGVEPGSLDKKCNDKKDVLAPSLFIVTGMKIMEQKLTDLKAPAGKYIPAGNLEAFKQSSGASSFGPFSLLNMLPGGIGNLLGPIGGGGIGGGTGAMPGMPSVNTYEGKELLPIAGVAGASGLVTFAAAKGGSALMAAPLMQSFSGVFIGATLAIAGAALIMSFSGISRGLGPSGTYMLGGMAGVGGAMAGMGGGGGTEAAGAGAAAGPPLAAIGIAIIVIVIIIMILAIAQGAGKMKKVEVSAECTPWQPPMGGADCEKCGDDNFTCNDYACSSLGGSCKLVGEAPNTHCINMNPNDVKGPEISILEDKISQGFEIKTTDSGAEIKKVVGETSCLEEFQGVTFGIKTNEYAYCKYSYEPNKKFEEMSYYPNEGNSLFKEFSITINSLDVLEYFANKGEAFEAEEQRDVNLYIKCQDAIPNVGEEFGVKLCVKKIDLTAPFLRDNTQHNLLPYGTEQTEIKVYAGEPVEVRWSFSDVGFDEMENTMNCPNTGRATECSATIPINENEIKVYARGRDHPEWAGTEKAEQRNTNAESLIIPLKKTETALTIDSVKPSEGEIIYTNLPATTVNVEVHISGGVSEHAWCNFGPDKIEGNAESPSVFKKAYESYTPGDKTLVIECSDEAGNTATKEVNFRIVQDLISPTITRVYREGESLFVITNEPGECAYSLTTCNFKVADGEPISISDSDGYIHSTSFDSQKKYYLECKDKLGNEKGECDMVVTGSSL